MAQNKMAGLTTSRKTPEADPAVALWRAALEAHRAFSKLATQESDLSRLIPAALRTPPADETKRAQAIRFAALDAAKRAAGLDAFERKSEAACKAMNLAENALALHGFKTPGAVVGGLHIAALNAQTDDLDGWPFALLRIMAEPMLAAVPEDLAAAFRADFPLGEIPAQMAVAFKAANPGAAE